MEKQIIVKRCHRYNHTRDVLYRGSCEYTKKDHGIILRYRENNKDANVTCEVFAASDHMEIRRSGETSSTLRFEAGKPTKGILTSPYGEIEIELYTYRYICREHVITLEYDINHGEDINTGYRILWNIKEGRYE